MKEFIEKLIERLEEETYDMEICEEQFDMNSPYFIDVEYKMVKLDDAIKIVNQLAEEHNNGWISVSERLPNKDLWCLATFESGSVDKIQYLTTNKWGWNGEFADNKVIAWQPLPESYKEEGNSTKKLTNADRIRNMSDEELAEFFNGLSTICEMCTDCLGCLNVENNRCKKGILDWLQSEAE